MRRLSVRRSASPTDTLALTAAGLGLGFVAGFLARGLIGEVGGNRLRRFMSPSSSARPVSGRAAADRIAAALRQDPALVVLQLEVLPVGAGRVELHGWAPDRRARARAVRLAGEAAPDVEVTNRLRVRGEDDLPVATPPEGEERLPA